MTRPPGRLFVVVDTRTPSTADSRFGEPRTARVLCAGVGNADIAAGSPADVRACQGGTMRWASDAPLPGVGDVVRIRDVGDGGRGSYCVAEPTGSPS